MPCRRERLGACARSPPTRTARYPPSSTSLAPGRASTTLAWASVQECPPSDVARHAFRVSGLRTPQTGHRIRQPFPCDDLEPLGGELHGHQETVDPRDRCPPAPEGQLGVGGASPTHRRRAPRRRRAPMRWQAKSRANRSCSEVSRRVAPSPSSRIPSGTPGRHRRPDTSAISKPPSRWASPVRAITTPRIASRKVVSTLASSTVAPVAIPIAPAAIASRRRRSACRHHAESERDVFR